MAQGRVWGEQEAQLDVRLEEHQGTCGGRRRGPGVAAGRPAAARQPAPAPADLPQLRQPPGAPRRAAATSRARTAHERGTQPCWQAPWMSLGLTRPLCAGNEEDGQIQQLAVGDGGQLGDGGGRVPGRAAGRGGPSSGPGVRRGASRRPPPVCKVVPDRRHPPPPGTTADCHGPG